MPDTIYVTTSIPYVNASPHIGHAFELVQADAIARYHRLLGERVILQTGTDENAHKNVIAARQAGMSVLELVQRNAGRFRELVRELDVSADSFIRTTEERHRTGVELLWRRLRPDDLYRQAYGGLYCQGCEDFLTEGELSGGKCPDHQIEPEPVSETNWFFRLSRYQRELEDLLEGRSLRVVPDARRSEVLAFVRSGLRDISVSRDAGRMAGWGIPVPGDASQTIYVWIDALMNYVTGLRAPPSRGWEAIWNRETRKVHVVGKNVWKFHAVYWPALLLSAGLPPPDEILVHGFLTVNGRKISKSLGNAVDPFAAAARRGAESLRHYLLAQSPFADGDYSEAAHDRIHESRLSSGLGNLLTRLTALGESAAPEGLRLRPDLPPPERYADAMRSYRFDWALQALWDEIRAINAALDAARPWKDPAAARALIRGWGERLSGVAHWLGPFMPGTSERILSSLAARPLRKSAPLFPRIGG